MHITQFSVVLIIFIHSCHGDTKLKCYSCRLIEQCFVFDPSESKQWKDCDSDTTHCVMERTVSAVTGAVVENRMCGGQVFVSQNKPLADGCYTISRQEDSRINTTRCYCSTSYCNSATSHYDGAVTTGTLASAAVAVMFMWASL